MNRKKLLIASVLLTLSVGGYFLFMYGDSESKNKEDQTNGLQSDSMDAADREIAARRTMMLKEQENPTQYIEVMIDPKKNIFGESVIEGNLKNIAKTTSYKDFELMIYWEDEVGAVMDSAVEVIFEGLDPGENVDFRTKRKGPRRSKAIQVKMRMAKVDDN